MEKIFDILKENDIEILIYEYFNYCGEDYLVIVGTKNNYLNIYVVNENFVIDKYNNLYFQDVDNCKNRKKYLKKKELEKIAIQYYLWHKYSTNDEIISFEILENKE